MPADRAALRGPRASLVAVARHAYAVVGVDVSGTRVRVGLCDLSGVVSEVVTVPVDERAGPDEVLETAVAAAVPLVHSAGNRLLGIGVGVPGPVDADGRRILLSVALGWHDVAVAERFERAFSTTAAVEYNVRAMALAEARYGLGRRDENLLYVHLGESFGVAFLVDGFAFRQGAHGVAELGHHQVDPDGPQCACGAIGCLEAILGDQYMRQRIRRAGRRSPLLAQLSRRRCSPLEMLDTAVHAGEPAAMAILDDVVRHLSNAIALSVNIFSPTRVALGGSLAHAPKDVIERVRTATQEKISVLLQDQVTIEPSAIGRYPGVLAAGTVALDRLFFGDHPPAPAARGSRRVRPAWATAAVAASD
jgi:predicted NBD/HSP70 family sugar kinase